MKSRDLVALFALAAVWGGSFLFIRIAVPVFGPVPLVTARVVIAAVVLWAGFAMTRRRLSGFRGNWGKLALLGGLNAALPFTLISAAELHLSASLASMLNATVPLFGLLLSATVLGDPLVGRQFVGLALGFAGVTTLVVGSTEPLSGSSALSVAAALVASLSYASAGLFTKRYLSHVPSPMLALGQQFGAAAWLLVPCFWQLPAIGVITAPALWSLLALALVSTAAAYLLYFHLMARVGPVPTMMVTYLIPIFGGLWGALFLNEPVTPGMAAGLGLVLASVLLANRRPAPQPAPPAPVVSAGSAASPCQR